MAWLHSCGQVESIEPTKADILENLTHLGNGVESVLNEDEFLENPILSDEYVFFGLGGWSRVPRMQKKYQLPF